MIFPALISSQRCSHCRAKLKPSSKICRNLGENSCSWSQQGRAWGWCLVCATKEKFHSPWLRSFSPFTRMSFCICYSSTKEGGRESQTGLEHFVLLEAA